MRAVVVGLGSIGRRHARNWAKLGLGSVAAVRRRKSPLPEALDFDIAEYTDLDQALRLERPDVVFVTNPTSLHVETACKALQAGAHVFVEKPLGSALDGVAELLRTARLSSRVLMVGYNLRFHPGLWRLKTLLQTDAVGNVISARAEAGEYLPDWHPWEDYRLGYSGRGEMGGGAVLTFSHELDALCWLLGPPRRVTAVAAHASSLEIDVEDVAEIALVFESGAVGSVHVDYVRRPPRRTVEVVGERGVLRWEYERNRLEHYSVETGQWRIEQGDARYDRNQMYLDELRHFVKCVRGEIAQALIDGDQGAAVLAVALAALRAARDGVTVDFRQEDAAVRGWLSHLGVQIANA
ncbi:MAG: Gfo/Idh/MocA family oxidoreductase [Chloroflexi bacterium]|nr:Gfo/Idh/MocA family oxidoreductase [Chloroflexota bacterium]